MDLKTHITEIIPSSFDQDSRVWIYQSDRIFNQKELVAIQDKLNVFVVGWTSHGAKVKGFATIYADAFVIIMADEKQTGVSGCSTDSSVRTIKEIEAAHQLNLFDRLNCCFLIDEKIVYIHLSKIQQAFDSKIINENSLYFNNTVLTKKQLIENWILPLKESWLINKLTAK
jgi:hypothetical protein